MFTLWPNISAKKHRFRWSQDKIFQCGSDWKRFCSSRTKKVISQGVLWVHHGDPRQASYSHTPKASYIGCMHRSWGISSFGVVGACSLFEVRVFQTVTKKTSQTGGSSKWHNVVCLWIFKHCNPPRSVSQLCRISAIVMASLPGTLVHTNTPQERKPRLGEVKWAKPGLTTKAQQS